MPRPINYALLDLFDYNDNNKIKCHLQDCKGKVLFRHGGNLQRHLKSLHPEIYLSYLENKTILQKDFGFYMQQKLIDLVRDKTILWDQSNMNENTKLYDDTWEEISQQLNLNVEICKQKWKNLRNHFRNETINKPGQKITDPESSWKLFSELLFLQDEVLAGESSENIKQAKEIDSILNSIKEESDESDVSEINLGFKTEDDFLENIINNSYDNNQCQKRSTYNENFDEQPKAKMIKTEFDNENEEEKMFLLSLLPYLKTIPEDRRLIVRHRIQGVLLEDKAHSSVTIESSSCT